MPSKAYRKTGIHGPKISRSSAPRLTAVTAIVTNASTIAKKKRIVHAKISIAKKNAESLTIAGAAALIAHKWIEWTEWTEWTEWIGPIEVSRLIVVIVAIVVIAANEWIAASEWTAVSEWTVASEWIGEIVAIVGLVIMRLAVAARPTIVDGLTTECMAFVRVAWSLKIKIV